MLCGLGIPLLRSLWGAVRNRQLYILSMYCKSCISFNFSILFFNLHDLPQEKNYTHLPQKKFNFFYNLHNLPQEKITRLDDFFVHELHFSRLQIINIGMVAHACAPSSSI